MNFMIEKSLTEQTKKQQELNFFLVDSVNKGDLEKIKLFIEKGADIHYLEDYALCHLTAINQLESVKYIIEQGANLYAKDNSPLKIAIINGFIDIIEYFLFLGANEDVVKEFSSYNSVTEAWFLAKELEKTLPIQQNIHVKHKL